MSREAMQMALEALESDPTSLAWLISKKQAITALRQALETEQEPVISTDHGPWIPSTHFREEGETYCKRCLLRDKFFGSRQCDPHIVYGDPPQRKPWVGLTDEEVGTLTVFDGLHHVETPLLADFIRAIEAKLKEKGHG